jgi:hypothetical protein
MSEPRVAALVCEGQTDVPVFRAMIQELWPSVEQVLSLQPELDEMGRAHGRTGWSEVRSWCEQHAADLNEVLEPLVGEAVDLLLIAIDVDIAIAAGIADPPRRAGAYESKRLRDVMEGWLGPVVKKRVPEQVVFSTPVMAIEAWVIAALFRQERAPEGLPNPAEFLVSKKKLRRSPKDDKPWKELHRYRDFAGRIARGLSRVRKVCPEAERTCHAIEQRRDAVGD